MNVDNSNPAEDSPTNEICNVADCDQVVKARGVCSSHYHQLRAQDMSDLLCEVEGCPSTPYARGMCKAHYQRFQRHGNTDPAPVGGPECGSFKHGLSNSAEYLIWGAMIQRCENPNAKSYPNYGGRGITVCKEWRDSFEAFYRDMGPRPSADLTLEREENDGNYEPDNCSWATRFEQNRNRRPRTSKANFSMVERAVEIALGVPSNEELASIADAWDRFYERLAQRESEAVNG